MDQQTVVRRSAGSTPITKPPGAMNSPFDTGAGNSPKTPRPPLPPLDIAALEIRTGVPIPAATVGPGAARAQQWLELYERMPAGGCVTMPKRHAESFYAWCKKKQVPLVKRITAPDECTVWKAEPSTAAGKSFMPAKKGKK